MTQDFPTRRDVIIGSHPILGILEVPKAPMGVVIFAHGSGSGRHSSRNNYVAAALRQVGIATLLIDLLTTREEADRRNVFDVKLLATRLHEAADWALGTPMLSRCGSVISARALERRRPS